MPHIEVVRVASSLPSVRARMPAPFEVRAVDGAAERIENQQLDPLAHLGGNLLVGQPRDEFGDPAGVDVTGAGMRHSCFDPGFSCHRAAERDLTLSHHGQTPAVTW